MRDALKAAFVFLLPALAVTYPAWLDAGARVPGSPLTDTGQHLWLLWWPVEALMEGRSITHTALINFPAGGDYYPLDVLNLLLCAPLQLVGRLAGVPLLAPAYTVALVLDIILGALGAYLLALRLTKSREASYLAGFIYGFSPFMLSSVHNGVSELMHTAYLPLFLLSLFGIRESPTARNALLCAGALLLACLANWYSCASTLGAALIFFTYLLACEARKRSLGAAHAKAYACALIVGALLFAPFVCAFLRHLSSPDALINPLQGMEKRHLDTIFLSPLASYLTPGKHAFNPLDPYYHTTYLGLGALLIALLTAGFRRHTGLLWSLCLVVFLTLSLGPFLALHLPGEKLFLSGRELQLPYYHLVKLIPGLDRLNFPYRLVVPALLSIAVLAALGLAPHLERLGRRARTITAAALCAAVLSEALLVSPAPFPIRTFDASASGALRALGEERERYGVIDVPLLAENLPLSETHGNFKNIAKATWGRYFYCQTVHRKGAPYVIENAIPAIWRTNALLARLNGGAGSPGGDFAASLEELRALGYRKFILHRELLAHPGETLLDAVPGLSKREFGETAIYEIPQAPR